MSSGIFRGKESSNRIELSRLVQDLLNFGVSGSLWLWGGGWVDGGGGVPPTHVHMHVHAHTCTHTRACTHMHTCTCMRGKHDNFMQMAAPLGEYLGIPYDVIHMCMCVCACVCMCMHVHVGGVHPLTTPHPIHPPPPPRIIQN